MPRLLLPTALSISLLSVANASAQSLSFDEIQAKMAERVGQKNSYRALLQDPDPDSALAAMQIMLESGDPELQRMALEHGLFSPSPVVQRTALQGFFDSGPVLNIALNPGEANGNGWFKQNVENWAGSIDAEGNGHISYKIGAYDAEDACYKYTTSDTCYLRLTDANVMANLWDRWWSLTLNEEGNLVGSGSMPNVETTVAVVVPIAQ